MAWCAISSDVQTMPSASGVGGAVGIGVGTGAGVGTMGAGVGAGVILFRPRALRTDGHTSCSMCCNDGGHVTLRDQSCCLRAKAAPVRAQF